MLCTPSVLVDRPSESVPHGRTANELRGAVQQVIAVGPRSNPVLERRREHRTPYPYLIKLSPVADDGETPTGEDIVVVGKHLSPGGIGFYHREPLAQRRMIAWLEVAGGRSYAVLVELLWCRFNKPGWYENGGRFVRLVDKAPV